MFGRLMTGTVGGAVLSCVVGSGAYAGTIAQGFEDGGFTFYAQYLSDTATLATSPSPVYAGTYSANIGVSSGQDDAEVDISVAGNGLTLGNLTSANYWVYLASGSNTNAPYICFPIATPGGEAYVLMFNPPDIGIDLSADEWTNIQINPNTTSFHIFGVDTGIADPNNVTLAEIAASDYSPGVTWGSFAINYADIEVGQEGDTLASNYYVDNLTITDSVPEPAPMAVLGVGLLGLAMVRHRRAMRA